MKALLRKTLLTIGILLYALRLHRLIIWLGRQAPKVLLYHACQPTENTGIAGLGSNRTPDLFSQDLNFLRRYYNVVPLSCLETGSIPERAVVVTFDDGYRSVYDYAFPILSQFGIPATVYLVTNVVDTTQWIWINELNYFLRQKGPLTKPILSRRLRCNPALPVEALLDLARANYDPVCIDEVIAEMRKVAESQPSERERMHLNWDEIRRMIDGRITFGNHTTHHPNLARLARPLQEEAIKRSRATLEARLGTTTSLAYPFGDHDEMARIVALETGHISIMEVGGVNSPLNLTRIARTTLTGLSDAERFAELEVVAPTFGYLKKLASWWTGPKTSAHAN